MSGQAGSVSAKKPSPRRASAARAATAPSLDYPLIAIIATLLALGLVEVFSASVVQVGSQFFVKQVMWVLIGVAIAIAMAFIPYRFWQRVAVPVMAITLVLLIAVLLIGEERLGAQRTLFGGRVQPSEIAKLAVVIYVAAWVASKKEKLRDVRAGLIPFATVMGVICGLVVLERSFSVTIIILVIGIAIFFLGGGDAKQLLPVGIIAAVVLVLLIYQFHYGIKRIDEWWQTLVDPANAPYQVTVVQEMIRRGGGIGTRPENWIQKGNVALLWSDFLFANVAADFRLPGAVAVVVLFAAFGYRGLHIALNAPTQFGALVAIGITTWILMQAIIHMGASVALFPATGIPLPFMSYGGSAMVSCLAGVGLLLSISRASAKEKQSYVDFSFGWRNGGPHLSNSGRRSSAPAERRTTKDQRSGKTGGERPSGGRKTHDDGTRTYGDWRTRVSQPPRHRKSIFRRGPARR